MTRRGKAEDPATHEHVLSMIIDGADQSAYGLPYFHNTTHSTQGKWKVKTHLMGAIVHGRKTYAYTYIDNIKHGNNLTIETLHRLLLDTAATEGKLPKTLYLQLDNTSKQCKGRFVLGYLACLVAWGLFDEVVLSFLPVGHTHEDIDQMFSCIARWLRKHDARCREEMHTQVKAAYMSKMGTRSVCEKLENAANISAWLEQFMAPTKKTATQSGISKFHQFKFTRQADNNVSLQVGPPRLCFSLTHCKRTCYVLNFFSGAGMEPRLF